MKNSYEERITSEIQRKLRYLDEACAEQNILLEEAVEWYRKNCISHDKIERRERIRKNDNLSYRERAEVFADIYVKGQQKEICTEVLCFMHEQEECPKVNEILTVVTSKVKIPSRNPNFVGDRVFMALEDLCKEYYGNDNYFASNWVELKNLIFQLSKSL